jgi:hypothetical protein
MQDDNMVGGMGGLMQDFSDLADDADRREMMASSAILGNLKEAGMIKGADFKQL